jgi:regulator of sirC expression with transglutaminase-like and TPR domain
MLNNLRGIYLQSGEREKALAATSRIIALMPEAAEELRDRGELYAELECFRAAVADLRHYLTLRPGAPDAAHVRLRLARLEPLAARLN